MKPNPVGWFEIYVQDMERARAFYENVFQLTLERLPPTPSAEGESCDDDMELLVFPMSAEDYGAPGALVRKERMPSGAGGTMVYFSCQDCAVEAARVAASGGTLLQDKFPIGEHGFVAIVNDSEGNTIGLHSRA